MMVMAVLTELWNLALSLVCTSLTDLHELLSNGARTQLAGEKQTKHSLEDQDYFNGTDIFYRRHHWTIDVIQKRDSAGKLQAVKRCFYHLRNAEQQIAGCLFEFSEDSFAGLDQVEALSLADNQLSEVPRHVLRHMPLIKQLDLSRDHLQNISSYDFKSLPMLHTLILLSNNITHLENGSLPPTVKYLSLAANNLYTLNGALRGLTDLVWLALRNNDLQNVDHEFPEYLPKLFYLSAAHNSLEKLPNSFKFAPSLNTLLLNDNKITSLNGSLSQSRMIQHLDVSYNLLEKLSPLDFFEQESLEDLQIGFNKLTALNGSLLPLKSLKYLNLTHNRLEEFSLQDIRGLKQLRIVDLSHNKIVRLGGKIETLVDFETRVYELKLEHNELETLDGSLSGIQGLQRLNISHNKLSRIAAGGLMGLENLKMLDISHNMLTTLEETAKTMLPSLEELIAHNNALTLLERDFHGLPVLCWADLGHNQIHTVHLELIEKTQCKLYGVNSTLKIYLHGNPVLCNEEMKRVFSVMETKNKSKIHGFEATDCSFLKTTTATTTVTSTVSPMPETSTVDDKTTQTMLVSMTAAPTTAAPTTTSTMQFTAAQTSASPVVFSYTETIRPMYNYIEDTTTPSPVMDNLEEVARVTPPRDETTPQPMSSTITYEVVQPVVVLAAPLEQVVNAANSVNAVNSDEVNHTAIDPVSITVSVA